MKFIREEFRFSFIRTLPILFSYLFLSIAFGIMMQETGLPAYWAWLASLIVYTGAFQFVLVSFFSAGASLLTVALTALAMNSRHIFYGITFLNDFKRMGKRYPYMIFSLTDETYALNCSTAFPKHLNKQNIMFYMAFLCWIYWFIGTVAGTLIGTLLPFDFTGIDFCMTALFVTIFIDQWKKAKAHLPAVAGICCAVVFLLLLGADRFILPALIAATGILILSRLYEERKAGENMTGEGRNE